MPFSIDLTPFRFEHALQTGVNLNPTNFCPSRCVRLRYPLVVNGFTATFLHGGEKIGQPVIQQADWAVGWLIQRSLVEFILGFRFHPNEHGNLSFH